MSDIFKFIGIAFAVIAVDALLCLFLGFMVNDNGVPMATCICIEFFWVCSVFDYSDWKGGWINYAEIH